MVLFVASGEVFYATREVFCTALLYLVLLRGLMCTLWCYLVVPTGGNMGTAWWYLFGAATLVIWTLCSIICLLVRSWHHRGWADKVQVNKVLGALK